MSNYIRDITPRTGRQTKITWEQTVNKMVVSLRDAAQERGVSLQGITRQNFNTFLDNAFGDGGEVRCEKFADLAWEYAEQYGTFAGPSFADAQWDCILEAVTRLEREELQKRQGAI